MAHSSRIRFTETLNMKVIVYTAIFGGYDTLRDTPFESVCITDSIPYMIKGWRYILFLYLVPPKERSFFCKTHPELFFPEADVTIWVDGNISLKRDPRYLVDKYLTKHEIALYSHPDRQCIYQEGRFCAKNKKAKPEDVEVNLTWLSEQGYPENNSLVESSFIIRRNTSKVRELNKLWWETFSALPAKRDQLSFNYAAWKLKMDYLGIQGYNHSRYFEKRWHMRNRD